MDNLGKCIKVGCAKREINQKELAVRCGYGRAYLSNVIGGTPISYYGLCKIANALDYSLEQFKKLGDD